ncbi:MAG: 3'-5' exonuclease, partial [Tabrizicola sp.]
EALGYETASVPSLTGFLGWLDAGEVEVTRRLDTATRAIRVMTVHGAKGLESPVVILPDTIRHGDRRGDPILSLGGRAVWRTNAEEHPAPVAVACAALEERKREERMRLLYVAMTRAECWLIVCGAGEAGKGTESWHSLVGEAIEKAGAVDIVVQGETGRRHESGAWPEPMPHGRGATLAPAGLPAWVHQRAPAPDRA